MLCAATAVRAGDVDDIAAPYLQRTDSIAAGAGNAKAVNSVTHMLDPWPPYAGNRRIPGNGQRMSGAVERYRDVRVAMALLAGALAGCKTVANEPVFFAERRRSGDERRGGAGACEVLALE